MEVGSSSLPGTTSEIIVNCQFPIIDSPSGGLAQLARAPALQAGGQRFESVILHFVTAVPLTVIVYWLTVIVTSFFDILTHKTVSKDFKLRN